MASFTALYSVMCMGIKKLTINSRFLSAENSCMNKRRHSEQKLPLIFISQARFNERIKKNECTLNLLPMFDIYNRCMHEFIEFMVFK